ncbi:hypothetical protein HG530_009743 [Fusarium avenaceum]|nr:hypothetical protein HG530_009743 [Fusarium avenaceum]
MGSLCCQAFNLVLHLILLSAIELSLRFNITNDLSPHLLELIAPAKFISKLANTSIAVAQLNYVVGPGAKLAHPLHVEEHTGFTLLRNTWESGKGIDAQTGTDDQDQISHGNLICIVVECLGERLAEEDNIWLDESLAAFFVAMRNLAPKDVLLHLIFRVLFLALDTALVRKASMRLNDLVRGDSGYALEAVDVLGE